MIAARVKTSARWLRRLFRQAVGPRPLGPVNPIEGFLLFTVALQGALVLLQVATPSTIEAALPPTLRVVWAGCLFAGGTASLAGLVWRWDPFDGIRIKRVGLIFAGSGTLAYGVALTAVGPRGLIAGLLNFGFAAACVSMVRQISAALRAANRELGAERRRHRRR